MGDHAKRFQPSKATTWMECPGSIALSEGIPDASSEYAEWGSDAHQLAELCLQGAGANPDSFLGRRMGCGNEVDDEMVACVQEYVDWVVGAIENSDSHYIEKRLRFGPEVGLDDPLDAFGSADALIFSHGECQVHDLKTGKGVKVSAERNAQLMLYALGAYYELSMLEDMTEGVRICIHQPRLAHYDEWWCSLEDLMVFRDEVATAVGRADQAAAPYPMNEADAWAAEYLSPGDKQCRFCRAKAICPARREGVLAMVTDDFVPLDAPGSKLQNLTERLPATDTQILANLYPHLDAIQEWCSAVRGELERRVLAGELPDQFKVVEGRAGNRRWQDGDAVLAIAKKKRLLDALTKVDLVSPTEAERRFKAGQIGPRNWSDIQELIVRPPGKPAVVPIADPRPAISADPGFTALPAEELA